MTFVFPLLLGGLLLAGVPVLLHFLIRKKPTTLLFPAFRFLMQKRRSNTRNLRLRHLLLLLLRVALIALICLALARPRVLHETFGLSRENPVALVLVFDTSPSMDYKSGDQTRLELAKKRCLELLDQLPEDGRVLILDTSAPAGFAREDWLTSLEKARQRVQGLTIRPTSSPVNRAIDEAQRRLDKLEDSDAEKMPRFVCVFSDRTRASWDSGVNVKRGEKVQTLYFDVGIVEPVDLAITHAELPGNRQSFTEGETILLRVGVKATGANLKNTMLVQIGKKWIEQEFELEAGKQQTLSLDINTEKLGLGPGLHQFEVKLGTEKDALAFNNVRYVTFAIQEKQRVLVLADDVAAAEPFVRALKSLLYAAEVRSVTGSKGDPFIQYEAIFLNGVVAPDDKLWTALAAFVQQGGGLGIIPPIGDAPPPAYNTAAALKLMPATMLSRATSDNGSWLLDANALDQPFLRRFPGWFSGDFEIDSRRAHHYWEVKPLDEKDVIIRYADGKPAIVERVLPKSTGKVLLLTTPMDDKQAWNNYYSNLHWFYPGLTMLCARHLCKEPENVKLNFQFGGAPPVVSKRAGFPKFLLPNGDTTEAITFDENDKWIGDHLPRAGNYTIFGTNLGETKALDKFSINVPAEESDLSRVPSAEIEAALGVGSLVPQDSRRLLVDTLSWDEPLELFPWLMILLLFLLALESLVANRFYRQEPAGEMNS